MDASCLVGGASLGRCVAERTRGKLAGKALRCFKKELRRSHSHIEMEPAWSCRCDGKGGFCEKVAVKQ